MCTFDNYIYIYIYSCRYDYVYNILSIYIFVGVPPVVRIIINNNKSKNYHHLQRAFHFFLL